MNLYNYMRAMAKDARQRGDMRANAMYWQQIHAHSAAKKFIRRLL